MALRRTSIKVPDYFPEEKHAAYKKYADYNGCIVDWRIDLALIGVIAQPQATKRPTRALQLFHLASGMPVLDPIRRDGKDIRRLVGYAPTSPSWWQSGEALTRMKDQFLFAGGTFLECPKGGHWALEFSEAELLNRRQIQRAYEAARIAVRKKIRDFKKARRSQSQPTKI
jgi:hypothetical protein